MAVWLYGGVAPHEIGVSMLEAVARVTDGPAVQVMLAAHGLDNRVTGHPLLFTIEPEA